MMAAVAQTPVSVRLRQALLSFGSLSGRVAVEEGRKDMFEINVRMRRKEQKRRHMIFFLSLAERMVLQPLRHDRKKYSTYM